MQIDREMVHNSDFRLFSANKWSEKWFNFSFTVDCWKETSCQGWNTISFPILQHLKNVFFGCFWLSSYSTWQIDAFSVICDGAIFITFSCSGNMKFIDETCQWIILNVYLGLVRNKFSSPKMSERSRFLFGFGNYFFRFRSFRSICRFKVRNPEKSVNKRDSLIENYTV